MHKLPGVVALNSWALTVVWSRYLPKSSGICDGGLGGSHTLPMPETRPPTVVAGAAIFDDRGWLLSARRTLPLHVAGKKAKPIFKVCIARSWKSSAWRSQSGNESVPIGS